METNSQLIKKIKEGGYNNIYPIAYIDGIIDKESNEKLSDILIRYNNIMVPWQGDVASTRNRVPSLMRRQGIVITYITDLSEIVTEVYKGTVEDIKNNWTDNINWELVPDLKFVQDNASKLPDGTITPEKLSPALQELISQSGSVVNMPDDEDLEQKDMVLKFKDRPYNSELASGKGYKILRKNWTNVGTKTINLLTQDVFNQSNTIYEIRYDFDLNNQIITIPENCILKYEGGSLNNGHIVYQNTKIQGIESLNNITTEGLFTIIDAVTDEEDLHNNNGVLKFADRGYNPEDFSGFGRVILRKNIVEVEDPIYGKVKKNILSQDMTNQANTIYVIQYDFTLGEDIIVPSNCVLEFDGGSISGEHTLTGNNTGIEAGLVKIFDIDVTLAGSWNVAEAYPEWFGAAPSVNSSDAIKKCIEAFAKTTFTRYAYIIEKTLTFENLIGKEINGNLLSRGVNGTDEYTLIASNEFEGNSIIHVIKGSGLKFSNLKIKGSGKSENGIIGLELEDWTYSVTIDHCTFNFCGKGISLGRCWNLSFIHCIFNEDFYGIYTYGTMTSSTFMDCVFYTSERALYFNGGTVYTSIIDCGFDGCTRGISVYSDCSINIINCGWEGYSEYGILGQNANAKLVLYNSYIQYQEGNVPFVGGYFSNIEFHDIAFPNGFTYACNGVNFINCSNVPYVSGTEAGQIDYVPIEVLVTKQGNTGFIQKGSKLVSVDEEIAYIYDRSSSIIYNNYLLIEITIVAEDSFYNGKIIVKANGFEISNPNYTSLFSFRKSDGSTESTCTIRFLKNCRVIINAIGRGIRAVI